MKSFWRSRDLLLLVLPALIWLAEVKARVAVIEPHCVTVACTPDKLPAIDRFLIGMEDPRADHYSFITQNLSGALAVTVPIAWTLASRVNPSLAIARIGQDLLIVLQTAFWNGAITEGVRILVQRPRPFVYADPSRGALAANYVSFYSGHTSGAAAAMMALFLILYRRGAPRWVLALSASTGFTLVFLTGVYRIYAGRHFLTDVIAGALAGAAVAYIVPKLKRRSA